MRDRSRQKWPDQAGINQSRASALASVLLPQAQARCWSGKRSPGSRGRHRWQRGRKERHHGDTRAVVHRP